MKRRYDGKASAHGDALTSNGPDEPDTDRKAAWTCIIRLCAGFFFLALGAGAALFGACFFFCIFPRVEKTESVQQCIVQVVRCVQFGSVARLIPQGCRGGGNLSTLGLTIELVPRRAKVARLGDIFTISRAWGWACPAGRLSAVIVGRFFYVFRKRKPEGQKMMNVKIETRIVNDDEHARTCAEPDGRNGEGRGRMQMWFGTPWGKRRPG